MVAVTTSVRGERERKGKGDGRTLLSSLRRGKRKWVKKRKEPGCIKTFSTIL